MSEIFFLKHSVLHGIFISSVRSLGEIKVSNICMTHTRERVLLCSALNNLEEVLSGFLLSTHILFHFPDHQKRGQIW